MEGGRRCSLPRLEFSQREYKDDNEQPEQNDFACNGQCGSSDGKDAESDVSEVSNCSSHEYQLNQDNSGSQREA